MPKPLSDFDLALLAQEAATRAYRKSNGYARLGLRVGLITETQFYSMRDKQDAAYYKRCDQIARNFHVYDKIQDRLKLAAMQVVVSTDY